MRWQRLHNRNTHYLLVSHRVPERTDEGGGGKGGGAECDKRGESEAADRGVV